MEQLKICNIWRTKCILKLRLGEYVCPVCKGLGGEIVRASFRDKSYTVYKCCICEGKGKVDWITNITHKDPTSFTTLASKQIKIKCPRNQKCKALRNYWRKQNHKKKYEINNIRKSHTY